MCRSRRFWVLSHCQGLLVGTIGLVAVLYIIATEQKAWFYRRYA
jgi:hypothetical protein